MDHLPSPVSSAVQPLEIPLITTLRYEGTFSEFPRRHGFFEDDANILRIAGPQLELAAFLQSWLWFGVVSTFAERRIDLDEFCRFKTTSARNGEFESPTAILDSTALKPLLENLESVDKTYTLSGSAPRSYADMSDVIDEAVDWSVWLDRNLTDISSPLPEILLSIKVLLLTFDSFKFVKNHSAGRDQALHRPFPYYRSIKLNTPPTAHLLIDWMVSNGWCPHSAYRICLQSDYYTAYYHALSRRPVSKDGLHKSCLLSECVVISSSATVDHSPLHTKPGCTCANVSVSEKKLQRIKKEGGTPVVSIKRHAHGKLKLCVQKAAVSTTYVAISHDPMDGLGNSIANSLPYCQLERLHTLMNRLPDPDGSSSGWLLSAQLGSFHIDFTRLRVRSMHSSHLSTPFWIDTLCIPVQDRTKQLQQRADNLAAHVFAAATKVLVLDEGIQQLRLGTLNRCDILANVLSSAWAQRLSTIQEVALSQSYNFQCLDGTFTPKTILLKDDHKKVNLFRYYSSSQFLPGVIQNTYNILKSPRSLRRRKAVPPRQQSLFSTKFRAKIYTTLQRDFKEAIHKRWNRTASYFETEWERCTQLEYLWCSLVSRSWSVDADLSAIFASVLHFNEIELAVLSEQTDRITAMLFSHTYLPVCLLFNRGPRIGEAKDHKNRWLPSTVGFDFLHALPLMKRHRKGYMIDNVRLATQNASVDIYVIGPEYSRKDSFVLRNPDQGFEAVIEICHPPNDEFVHEPTHNTCLLLHTYDIMEMERDYLELKGACLQVCRDTTSPSGVRCVDALYNCPVRVHVKRFQSTVSSTQVVPIVEASVLQYFEVAVQYDDTHLKVKLPITRELNQTDCWQPFYLFQYPIILLSGITELVATIMMFFIAKNSFNESSTMARTAMVLVCCRIIPHGWPILTLVHTIFLWLLPIPLFIAARAREHHFSRLDKLYIALNCGSLLASIFGVFIFFCVWTPIAYRAWLASFGPYWPTRLCSTNFIRRVAAFETRVSKIRFVRELFGVGYLEEHGLRGMTNMGAIHNFIGQMCLSMWEWLEAGWKEASWYNVVVSVLEYGKEKS